MSSVPRPHTDFKFHPRITQIGCYWGGGGHTELYLLEGDGLALVDTGVATTPADEIAAALAAINRTLADIDLIINTHGHHDHADGNPAVVAAAGCPVWLHGADARITQEPVHAVDLFTAPGLALLGRDEEIGAARTAAAVKATAPVARELADGDLLELGRGLRLRVLHTPGHTLGCITLLWELEGLAIAGDSVPCGGSRPGGLPLIFYPDAYRRTLARLRGLSVRTLCLGHHYFSLTLTRESVKLGIPTYATYVSEAETILDRIEEAVAGAIQAAGGAPFPAVAGRALSELRRHRPVGEVHGDSWPPGVLETLAAVYRHQTGQAPATVA